MFNLSVCYAKSRKLKRDRTVIVPVVLCGCETWSLILREERRLRMLENMALRGILGPEREGVTVEWGKPHNEVFDLYCLMICTA